MDTPYTTSTGLQIGIQYISNPKPHQIIDEDMLLLQEALLTPVYQRTNMTARFFSLVLWDRS